MGSLHALERLVSSVPNPVLRGRNVKGSFGDD